MRKPNKIIIKQTIEADSRTASVLPSKETLLRESKDHIDAVAACMAFFGEFIRLAGQLHDHTKIDHIDEFYKDFTTVFQDKSKDFKSLEWWQIHLQERHHLNDKCPEDVNLVDVLEMICDCVTAGLARSGSVRPVEISPEILVKAVANTADMLIGILEVEPEKKDNE